VEVIMSGALCEQVSSGDEELFGKWLQHCDLLVTHRYCVGLDDLPDASWRDYYSDGLKPIEAVEAAEADYWRDELP